MRETIHNYITRYLYLETRFDHTKLTFGEFCGTANEITTANICFQQRKVIQDTAPSLPIQFHSVASSEAANDGSDAWVPTLESQVEFYALHSP